MSRGDPVFKVQPCFWCGRDIELGAGGYSPVHVDTQYAMCEPGTANLHHAMPVKVGIRNGYGPKKVDAPPPADEPVNIANAIEVQRAQPDELGKGEKWGAWRHYIIGRRAVAFTLTYEDGTEWSWSAEQGDYTLHSNDRALTAPDGSVWTAQGLVKVRTKKAL